MAQTLSWSFRARRQLQAICNHIAEDDPIAAEAFAEGIVALAEGLPAHPYIGRAVPEYGRPGLRERIYGRYRLVYRLLEDEIEVAAVYHGARRLPDSL